MLYSRDPLEISSKVPSETPLRNPVVSREILGGIPLRLFPEIAPGVPSEVFQKHFLGFFFDLSESSLAKILLGTQ